MRFVDEATITVRSGKGGNGSASLFRGPNMPKGGPDGGDGGKGGDVCFRASRKLVSLYDFRLKRLYEAKNGQCGMGRDRYGKAADDLIVDLPVGTLVYEIIYDHEGTAVEERLIADLSADGKVIPICKGGIGGRGNLHFKSSTNRTPRYAEEGKPNEERKIRLELKILADAGLLGLPNAGKSTFLSAVSAARPKIAAYPFTTLVPNLGVIENAMGEQLIIADIPGLVEGASEGIGLGYQFLKHVERTRFLVHIVSAEDLSTDDPTAAFDLLNDELGAFDDRLAEKKQIHVVNKIDLLDEEELEEIKKALKEVGIEPFFMSALEKDGLNELLASMWERHKAMADEDTLIPEEVRILATPAPEPEVEEQDSGDDGEDDDYEVEVFYAR